MPPLQQNGTYSRDNGDTLFIVNCQFIPPFSLFPQKSGVPEFRYARFIEYFR